MKVRLIKIGKIGLPDLLFLIVFISFYISRYHFSQVFRSLFRIIHKKDFCHEFSFLTDSLKQLVSFLLALKEILETCLSNLNSLSIVTPKSFTSTFFYILFPTIIFILKTNLNNININKDLTLIRVIFPNK